MSASDNEPWSAAGCAKPCAAGSPDGAGWWSIAGRAGAAVAATLATTQVMWWLIVLELVGVAALAGLQVMLRDIIEVRNGTVSVDGQALSGGEVRTRLGADADLILRITYLDAADQRQLTASGQADTPAQEPERRDPPRPTRGSAEMVRIGDDVTVSRGEVIEGDVVAVFGNARIDGEVNGELTVVMGNADLGPESVVRDDVTVVGGRLNRAPCARIEGSVENVAVGPDRWRGAGFPGMVRDTIFGRVGSLAGTLFRVAFVTLLALVVVAFGRRGIERIADRTSADPLRAGLTGFLAQLLFFPVLLLIVLLVGFTGVAYQVGRLLHGRFGWTERGPYATVLLGVMMIALVTVVARSAAVIGGSFLTFPLSAIGYLVEYVAWTLGFGAVVLVWLRERRQRGGWGFDRHSPDPSAET